MNPQLHSQDGIQDSEKTTGFQCPTCDQSNLRVGNLGNCEVCFCLQCQGFVIDRASLGDLVESLRAAYEGPEDRPQMIDPAELHIQCSCPACLDTMETFPYFGPGNVVIDTCEGCKLTWLNNGELKKIIRAPGRREYPSTANYESSALRAQFHTQAMDSQLGGTILLGGLF